MTTGLKLDLCLQIDMKFKRCPRFKVEKSIEHTFDYFVQELKIPLGRLLPYTALIVPFAYFFYKNKNFFLRNFGKFPKFFIIFLTISSY